MKETLRRMQKKRANGDAGFTLVELLVVVVIIGVLVAIAIPMYLNYRKGAANKSAESDVRAAVSAVELYYTENGNKYPTETGKNSASGKLELAAQTDGKPATVNVSPDNTLRYAVTGSGTGYVICGTNTDGGDFYQYKSGGAVKKVTASTLDACMTAGGTTPAAT